MVSPGIRAVIQRLHVDDDFRRAFVRSPDLALSKHDFSAEERRALLRLRVRLATAGGPGQLAAFGEMTPWP